MRTTIRTALGITFLAASLTSQSFIVPKAYSTKEGGRGYAIPFSYGAYLRHQQLIAKSEFTISSLTGMAFRSRTRVLNVRERAWQELRVQLSHSAKTLSTMSTNYAANHGKDVKTVFNGKMDLYKYNSRIPLEFNCTVPFSTPFLYLKTADLCVDLYPQNNGYEFNTSCPQGGNGTGMDFAVDPLMRSVQPAKNRTCTNTPPTTMSGSGVMNGGYVLKFFNSGVLMPYGRACRSNSGKAPLIGSSGGSASIGNSNFKITLSGANPSGRAAYFVMGLSNRKTVVGNTRLPLTLNPTTSVTSCWQNADQVLGFPVGMTAGSTALPAAIPNNNALRGVEVFAQFATDEPGVGFAMTQGGLVRVQ